MKKAWILLAVLGHLAGLTGLVFLAVVLDGWFADPSAAATTLPAKHIFLTVSQWRWLWTELSTAALIYSWGAKLIFDRSPNAQLWWYRVKSMLRKTHTHWLPAFTFEIDPATLSEVTMEALMDAFVSGGFGHVTVREQTASTMTVDLEKLGVVLLRKKTDGVHVAFDREFLVPSHLYTEYEARLVSLTEMLRNQLRPREVRCSITVSFKDGAKNPYYGLFINSIPADALKTFSVIFSIGPSSKCRIEAHKDCVVVDGPNFGESFRALNNVLSMKAMPGVAAE